ncbi:MAG: 50S ribosomal protein L29 [Lentisphaerae bacterium]|jgi:large subunit ribosomal protein L29|nr:50S ribosomal protein L29 [Lentisphaerota bacterium]
MKAREMRELGADELAQRIREYTQDLRDLRLRHRSGSSVDRPLQIRSMRREIARMLTVQRGREAGK